MNGDATRGKPKDGDVVRIASEGGDVPLHPLQGGDLVHVGRLRLHGGSHTYRRTDPASAYIRIFVTLESPCPCYLNVLRLVAIDVRREPLLA